MNEVLRAWNTMGFEEAVRTVLPCNGSVAWAHAVTLRRPFAGPEALFAFADEVWRTLPQEHWQQAFASHPRLGETSASGATAQSLAWSRGEQGALSGEEVARRVALAAGNREYEARFGQVFLLCATGRTAAEILAALQQRLANDAASELLEAAEQQRRITQLRLRKWLGMPAGRCDSV